MLHKNKTALIQRMARLLCASLTGLSNPPCRF